MIIDIYVCTTTTTPSVHYNYDITIKILLHSILLVIFNNKDIYYDDTTNELYVVVLLVINIS